MITLYTVLATIMHSVSPLTSLSYKLPHMYQWSGQMHLPQIATPPLHPLPWEHRASLRHPHYPIHSTGCPYAPAKACPSALPTHYNVLPPLQHRPEPQPTPLGPPPEQASPPLVQVHIYCALMQVHLRIFASPPLCSSRTRWAGCHCTAHKHPVAPCIHLVSCNVNHLDCIKL